MKIGIIGAGEIGSTLARKFSKGGHTVKLANSRGPESLKDLAAEIGVTPVTSTDAVKDVDVVVVALPMLAFANLPKGLFDGVSKDVVVIDAGNYYPLRDGRIDALEQGTVESVWVSEQLGHPVIKTFNSIRWDLLLNAGQPSGSPERIALPVAGDDPRAKAIAIDLVELAGFDPVDAGSLAESWRQQPGTPCYCTDYGAQGVRETLAQADKARAPALRDISLEKFSELKPGFDPKVLTEILRSIK